jgi:hypothetical protein
MVHGHLSEGLRYRVQFEYDKTGSIAAVARKLKINRKTAERWVKRGQLGLGVCSKPGRGRKPALTSTAACAAAQLLLSGEFEGTQKVAQELHRRRLAPRPVHRTTVAKHAKMSAAAAGHPIYPARGTPAKQLTPANEEARLRFSRANKRRNWGNVMITDRKRFLWRYPRTKVNRVQWKPRGQRRTAPRVNHPMSVNLYMGITKHGATKPILVAGTSKMVSKHTNKKGIRARNITGTGYAEVLKECLLPEGARLFGAVGLTSWVLQQDNDPSHKKAAREEINHWNKKHHSKVQILKGWPANSPDLSPIENVWGIIQAKVDGTVCNTFEEFVAAVEHECKSLSKRLLGKLFRSMPDRLSMCIERGGGKTTY